MRGNDTDESDLDLLVDPASRTTLMTRIRDAVIRSIEVVGEAANEARMADILRSLLLSCCVLLTRISPAAASVSGPRAADWPAVGGDLANSRYSTLSQIDISNVKTLGGVWEKDLDAPSRTPPVVVAGVMYINDASAIYALDAKSGQAIWHYKPEGSTPARGGVAIGEGRVFCGLSDTRIIALDSKTGKLVWTGYIGNAPPGSDPSPKVKFKAPVPAFSGKIGIIVSAPTYVKGRVISGLSGGDGGTRGKVVALDAKTGKLVWTFYTIPSKADPGSETWPQDGNALQQGGAAVWIHGPADPELGLIYYGTGNAVPPLGGEIRPGDNLYTASIVALNIATGKLAWHYQLTHHDVWDMDIATPLVLYTARVDGHPRKALAAARTDGYLFLLDRKTGKPIHPVEERSVKQDVRVRTAATQPFPVGADRIGPACADPQIAPKGFALGCWFDPLYTDSSNVIVPLSNLRQAPMSYDPGTGYFYAMAQVNSIWARRTADPFSLILALPPGSAQYGLYAAIDSRTEKIVWQKKSPWGLSGGSGALTTKGGLLFHMEGDGSVQADNARTGETLWKFQTGSIALMGAAGQAGGVPLATYAVDGVQYVALVSYRALWTFSLGGSLPPREPSPPPPQVAGFSGLIAQLPSDGSGEIVLGPVQRPGSSWGQAPSNDDEFAPVRVQVRAGVGFKWTNRGSSAHTISADDGSWTVGPITTGQSAVLTISKPGSYSYSSAEAPWIKGQIIVRSTAKAQSSDSTNEGVFLSAQAAQGQQEFETNCASCHGADLGGREHAPALAGDSFLQQWHGHSVGDLFERISLTMPQQTPHSLSDHTYVDIVSFILQANGFPYGSVELKSDPGALSKVTIQKPGGE
jgi:quinohemoprotein ethanol dehydrogenase